MRNLTLQHFVGDKEQSVYDYIRRHYRRYGALPNLDTITEDTRVRIPRILEGVDYYQRRVADRLTFNTIKPQFAALRDAMTSFDMEKARETISDLKSSVRVHSTTNDVLNFQQAAALVTQRYDHIHASAGGSGILTGWEPFDAATGGYQRGDLISWVARLGVGKTYLMLKQVLQAWMDGRSVLLVTMEMTIEQIVRRLVAMYAGINPDYIRKGTMSNHAYRRLERYIGNMRRAEGLTIYAGGFSKSMDDVEALAQETSPDMVWIDGAYLLRPTGNRRTGSRIERVAEVWDDLKKATITLDRPIAVTTQFSRQAGKRGKDGSLESISFTDAVGMHSSLVASIKEGKPPYQITRREIELLKGREGETANFEVDYRFNPISFNYVPSDVVEGEATNIDWMA